MSEETKLVHIQDDRYFLSTVSSQSSYNAAAAIRELIRDREEEVDRVYGPVQARQKERAKELKTERQQTELERVSWLVIHDSKGEKHQLSTMDNRLKELMSRWSTEQHLMELESRRKQNDLLRDAQEQVRTTMLTQAAGDPELVKTIQEEPFLSAPPMLLKKQSNSTLSVDVCVLDVTKINHDYLEVNVSKIKALAKSVGIYTATTKVGHEGVRINPILNPRLKPRRNQ